MKYEICYDGGLGDFLIRMLEGTGYANLNNLKPEDTCDIHIVSHNPFCRELWEWHPKRAQLNLIIHPWREVTANHQIREMNNIPQDFYPPPCSDKPIIYPSPEDIQALDVLARTEKLKPFVVISAVAGSKSRNISMQAVEAMVPALQAKGYDVVAVGRTYQRADQHPNNDEYIYGFNKSVISMIDKLTIPGTLKLLEMSAGLIACHSAMALGNWFLYRRPNIIFYPSTYAKNKRDIQEMNGKDVPLNTEDCYTFGRKFHETQAAFNEKFSLSMLDMFP